MAPIKTFQRREKVDSRWLLKRQKDKLQMNKHTNNRM